MSGPKSSRGDGGAAPEVPSVVTEILGPSPELVWHNELGGLTYRSGDRFLKWSPRSAGIDLRFEQKRLSWLRGRHPTPRVLDHGSDDDAHWFVTRSLPGEMVVGGSWRSDPDRAISAIAAGLRALHAVDPSDVPADWFGQAWHERHRSEAGPRPVVELPVLVHGDACAPNTLATPEGAWTGHVDLGDLGVGDRWADLAIAAMSLAWNYDGDPAELEACFYAEYGCEPDPDRIAYYRALWRLES